MIVDYLHTENTDGHGCPQADSFFGEQQLTEKDSHLLQLDELANNYQKNISPRMTHMDTDECS